MAGGGGGGNDDDDDAYVQVVWTCRCFIFLQEHRNNGGPLTGRSPVVPAVPTNVMLARGSIFLSSTSQNILSHIPCKHTTKTQVGAQLKPVAGGKGTRVSVALGRKRRCSVSGDASLSGNNVEASSWLHCLHTFPPSCQLSGFPCKQRSRILYETTMLTVSTIHQYPFWCYTPRELQLFLCAYGRRRLRPKLTVILQYCNLCEYLSHPDKLHKHKTPTYLEIATPTPTLHFTMILLFLLATLKRAKNKNYAITTWLIFEPHFLSCNGIMRLSLHSQVCVALVRCASVTFYSDPRGVN